jgi:rod shape-determining protein MreD
MKRLVLILLMLLAVIFQTAVFPQLSIWGIFPNIIFIIMVSFCLSNNYVEACVWAVAGGLMLDIFSAKSFGISALSLLLGAVVIYFISMSLEFSKTLSRIILGLSASAVYYIALIIFSILFDLMKISDNLLALNWRTLLIVIVSTIINTALILIISPLIALFNQWLIKVERRLETKLL